MMNRRIPPFAASLAALLLISGCSTPGPRPQREQVQAMSSEAAARFAPYAMMAANAYHGGRRERFPVARLGWQHIDLDGLPTTKPSYKHINGLAFDVFKKQGENTYVIAFRGTDNFVDWPAANLALFASPQYATARQQFRKFFRAHADARVIAVGHSLGGGLSIHVSVRSRDEHGRSVDAIAFDSSPRFFDGLSNKHGPGKREMVYEEKEILYHARRVLGKINRIVGPSNIYETKYGFGKRRVARHNMQKLAKELVKHGAKVDPELRSIVEAFPPELARR